MSAPLKWKDHRVSFHPKIWDMLGVIADQIYDGNKTRAINSIALFSVLHFFNETAKGRKVDHWVTAPSMKDPAQLESILVMIERLARGGDPEELGEWWAHELRERREADAAGGAIPGETP